MLEAQYTEEFKEYTRALVDACRDVTKACEYNTFIHWDKFPDDKSDDETETIASVSIDDVYLNLRITIYPMLLSKFIEREFEDMGRIILHEFCHHFFAPVQKLYEWDVSKSQWDGHRRILERQVQRVTNALFALMKDNWWTYEVLSTNYKFEHYKGPTCNSI